MFSFGVFLGSCDIQNRMRIDAIKRGLPCPRGGSRTLRAARYLAFAIWLLSLGGLAVAQAVSPSANNNFADAVVLQGTELTVEGNNALADREPGEPPHGQPVPGTALAGKTLWWQWTSPADGELELVRNYEITPLRVETSIYVGNALSNLILIGHTTNLQWNSKFFRVEQGTTYRFAVDTVDESSGTFLWRYRLRATPANDAFEHRTALSPTGTEFSVSLGTASRETGEPLLARGKTIGKSLWWTFTPPSDGTIVISAAPEGAHVQVALAVYTESQLPRLKRRVEGKDAVTLRVQRGVAYQIATDPTDWSHWFWGGYVSGLSITFRFDPVPDNDSFSARVSLTGTSLSVTGRNASATRERGEPRHAGGQSLGASIWYTWTAPADGWAYVSARGESFTPVIAVYDGPKFGALKQVTQSVAGAGLFYTSIVGFATKAGRAYQIALDGTAEERLTGKIELDLDFSTLHLVSPADGSSHASLAPPTFAVSEPNVVLDGAIAGVGYVLGHEWFGEQPTVTSLVPPFTAASPNPSSLPPGLYGAVALVTNIAGTVHATPPIRFRLTPPGDSFTQRLPLTGYQWHVESDLAGATLEPGEPRHGSRAAGSVWYSWTAPASGLVEFSAGLPENVSLIAYQGTELKGLKRLALRYPNPWTRTFNAVEGSSYCFAIIRSARSEMDFAGHYSIDLALRSLRLELTSGASFSNDDQIPLSIVANVAPDHIVSVDYLQGDVVIGSNQAPPFSATWFNPRPGDYSIRARARMSSGFEAWSAPVSITVKLVNDHFAARKVLQGLFVRTNTTLFGGTLESGEPRPGPQTPNTPWSPTRSAWWSWTPEVSSRVWVNYVGNPGLATVGIWTGQVVNGLTEIPIRYRDTISGVEFAATAGVTYHIQVSHASATEGYLQVRAVLPPTNDLFTGRISLQGTSAILEGHNLEAARQPGEPLIPFGCSYPGRLVWWSWTAPADGTVSIVNPPSHGGPCFRIRAYVGDTLESLIPVSSEDSHDSAAFVAVGGAVYQIAVDTSVEAERISLNLTFQPTAQPMAAAAPAAPRPPESDSTRVSSIPENLASARAAGSAIGLRMTGTADLEVIGLPGQRFRLEASSNLVDWTILIDGQTESEPFRFTDPERGRHSMRFYRVVARP